MNGSETACPTLPQVVSPSWETIFSPTPLRLQWHADDDLRAATGFAPRASGYTDQETADLHELFAEIGLAATDGLRVDVIRLGQSTPRPLEAAERHELEQTDEAYLLEIRGDQVWIVAGGYRGAVHACERLRQWATAPIGERQSLTMLDRPVLAVRGMNRDDAEDWSESYWQTTIDFARRQFLNLLGISAELLVAESARGDREAYQQRVAQYQRIEARARRAGIRLVPMIYNVDHFLGQFLHLAGRDDLTEHFERRRVRYDLDEAWELGVNIFVEALAPIQPETMAQWASEMIFEFYGDRRVTESLQLQREAWFYRELCRRLRARSPRTTVMAIMSQAVRDRVSVFTDALAGEPVEFVHYDGEWTYSAGCPALTTRAARESIAAGHPWIAKPAWSRVVYRGLPYIHVRRAFHQCQEVIREGFVGIFPNASRWQAIPWNTQAGAAAAWAGDRAPLDHVIDAILCRDGIRDVTSADVLALDEMWTRACLFNVPAIRDGTPRLSAFRCVPDALVTMVYRAAREPDFQISTLEEVQLESMWHGQSRWFHAAREQVQAWQARLDSRSTVWSASVSALAILLELYSHALAAAWVVNREYCRDAAKGPWRAWRPLLGLHVQGVRAALERLRRFQPLDGQFDRAEGELFASVGAKFNHALEENIDRLAQTSKDTLAALADPAAFAALKSSPGFDGDWPAQGLYTTLDWPL